MEPPKPSQPAVQAAIADDDLWGFYGIQEPYISRNIQLADAKAGIVAAGLSGIVTFLLKSKAFSEAVRHSPASLSALFGITSGHASRLSLSALLTVCLLGAAIFSALLVVLPRRTHGTRIRTTGLISWVDIAAHAPPGEHGSYYDELKAATKERVVRERLNHLYALSVVCARKMAWLHWTTIAGAAGLAMIFVWTFAFSISH